MKSEEDHQ
jgi:hypothetical protein